MPMPVFHRKPDRLDLIIEQQQQIIVLLTNIVAMLERRAQSMTYDLSLRGISNTIQSTGEGGH